jgi:ParB-like chromosome segregation protein Spo0J
MSDSADDAKKIRLIKKRRRACVPIVVNERYLAKSGKYELVCGYGRLRAHKRMSKTRMSKTWIEAEVLG